MTPAVHELCLTVWRARDKGTLTKDDVSISREIYRAVASDLDTEAAVKYDPEMDRRVEWLREVARQRRLLKPHLRPEADSDLENLIEWMLFHEHPAACGKDLAAGN
jgi:hypothetical protein